MEVSKVVASDFVDKCLYDWIGLAIFVGEAFIKCLLIVDYCILKGFLGELECGEL